MKPFLAESGRSPSCDAALLKQGLGGAQTHAGWSTSSIQGFMRLKSVWVIIKETISEFVGGAAFTLSAATAYSAMFSIAPLLVLVIGLAGLVFGEQQVRAEVQRRLGSFVGAKATHLIESMMSAQFKGGSLKASIIGGVALYLGRVGFSGSSRSH